MLYVCRSAVGRVVPPQSELSSLRHSQSPPPAVHSNNIESLFLKDPTTKVHVEWLQISSKSFEVGSYLASWSCWPPARPFLSPELIQDFCEFWCKVCLLDNGPGRVHGQTRWWWRRRRCFTSTIPASHSTDIICRSVLLLGSYFMFSNSYWFHLHNETKLCCISESCDEASMKYRTSLNLIVVNKSAGLLFSINRTTSSQLTSFFNVCSWYNLKM